MKIISKYKDYYDYLSGIYGIDEKIVLDRTSLNESIVFYDNIDEKKIILHICDREYQGVFKKGRFYWGKQLEDIKIKFKKSFEFFNNNDYSVNVELQSINTTIYPGPRKSKLNRELNCPIIYSREYGTPIKYPKLSDFNLAGLLPPKEIYLLLTDWLSPKEDIADKRTNKEKILTNGFDLKSSFRNPIK